MPSDTKKQLAVSDYHSEENVIHTQMRVVRCVVIGNGPAGFMFVKKLLEYDLATQYKITVIGEEPNLAYDRVNLTKAFTGDESRLTFADTLWYTERQIDLLTGIQVTAIDLAKKRVKTSSGLILNYDKLVLATGSSPFIPSIEGKNLPGVFAYRTLEDVHKIKEAMSQSKNVAVLGGGLLGLEAAKAMLDAGLETHVIEQAPVLMARQLDELGAKLLETKIKELGVHIHLLKRTQCIKREQNGNRLVFDDDSYLDVDLVIFSAGIRPRDELARLAGLKVGPRGGVIVNENLQTSDASVFAIGECALVAGKIYGLAAPGYLMADILANNFCGGRLNFPGSDESTRLKLMGVDVSLMGDYLNEINGEILTYRDHSIYKKIVLHKQKIVGLVGVGAIHDLPRLQESIGRNIKINYWMKKRFTKTGELWPEPESIDISSWPSDAIVCGCRRITLGELKTAMLGGALTLEDLAEKTGASKVCGSCKILMASLVSAPTQVLTHVPGSSWLLVAGYSCLLILLIWLVMGSIPYANSVSSPLYKWEVLWKDSYWKQISGFTLLCITSLALTLSLRKRISRLAFLNYGWWRAAHGIVGLITILGVMFHTGMRVGQNLNFVLMMTFLGINTLGACTGIIASLETRVSLKWAQKLKNIRPVLTWVHILFFWPFPILVVYHIASFYLL